MSRFRAWWDSQQDGRQAVQQILLWLWNASWFVLGILGAYAAYSDQNDSDHIGPALIILSIAAIGVVQSWRTGQRTAWLTTILSVIAAVVVFRPVELLLIAFIVILLALMLLGFVLLARDIYRTFWDSSDGQQ